MESITQYGALTPDVARILNANFAELAAPPNVWYVDGDNGDNSDGSTWAKAFLDPQDAIDAASAGDTIYIRPKAVAAGGTDPSNYAVTLTIPAGKSGLRLIGVGAGPVQGGVPQIKKGSGSTALLTVRSPGCLIAGLGFNGSGSTGGGILLDDDGSTKSAFGTVIVGCHFKNCKGHATDGTQGGAIYWSAAGGAWQVRIEGNTFYDNVAAIVLKGTTGSRPKDVVIKDNVFGSSAATVPDVYIYGAGGSGFNDVVIDGNKFMSVLPNNTSGTVHRYIDITGVAAGIVSRNDFGVNGGQYGAAASHAKIPTTVGICCNYQDGALIART